MALTRFLAVALTLLGGAGIHAQPPETGRPTVPEALRMARHELTVTPGGLGGDGGSILTKAVGESRFIVVGEDHVTREIPALVSALCDETGPELSGLALEVGPRALIAVRPLLTSPDRIERMAAFNRRYPSAIAFLDDRHDNDMAAHCLQRQPKLRLIGVDQEFLGSAGLLLDLILAERLSPEARREMQRLREIEQRDAQAAAASGDPGKLFLLAVSEKDLALGQDALARGGTRRAIAIFSELCKSREIYLLDGNASNQLRAKLLKTNLNEQLPITGKIIVKVGDWHAYRGYNPLGNRDLGNWIAERADQDGPSSLHILVLGAKGIHALYGGYAQPLRLEPFKMAEDHDYRWLQAAIDATSGASSWSLFDLRSLRARELADVGPEWRRVLDGFDLLILVPELTPSGRID